MAFIDLNFLCGIKLSFVCVGAWGVCALVCECVDASVSAYMHIRAHASTCVGEWVCVSISSII